MSERPSIAFVVPAFNGADTLGDTLESLCAQTRGDWEAVVVDDGSRDGTAGVAGGTGDGRVRVHRQENRGLAGARNAGLERITAPVVCFVDADDTVAPTYAARMLSALGEGVDLAPCWYRYVGPALEDLGWTIAVGAQDLGPDRLLEFNPLVVGGVGVRAEAARGAAVNGEVFRTALVVHEDWDLWLRMVRGGARWGRPVEEPLYNYRMRRDSMSTDLGLMWRAGCELIDAAAGRVGRAAAARRGWTVRNLARAAAHGDPALVRELLASMGEVREADVGVLAGALRWALCREELIGPGQVEARAADWKGRVARALAGQRLLGEILRRMEWSGRRWEDAVGRAVASMGPGDSLAIYGLGRNGQEALRVARRAGVRLVAVDDDPAAEVGVARVRAEELTDRHVVLVTPDDRSAIIQRLARLCVSRVVLPDGA